jgi:hypothetical protein
MVRAYFSVLGILLGVAALGAEDLGRTDHFWREYLSETVRRGLPVLASGEAETIPYWPALERSRTEAATLEPGPDVELIGAWVDLQQGEKEFALETLQKEWPKPKLSRFSPRAWGEALFSSWEPGADPQTWTQAWLSWQEKVYSPAALVRGLEVLEQSDHSAVVPLLTQALELHSEDRRFLPFVVRHPEAVPLPEELVSRDRLTTGGWSDHALRVLLNRNPSSVSFLVKAGYPRARLDSLLARDYGTWLASDRKSPPSDGEWTWDSSQTGRLDSRFVFRDGILTSWTKETQGGGLWTLTFASGQPETLSETREGATWALIYETYPWVRTLEYRWGQHTIVYRFRPLTQKVPLWPAERFQASVNSLPSVLADLWLPLDPKALALSSATVETWEKGLRVRTVFLFRGQVWLSVEDVNRDGREDTWSYYRSGTLVSVYHDTEGNGQVNLQELYKKGELAQVQTKSATGKGVEFVLFPAEGVQLWDPHGDGRPLERIFVWPGQGELQALVFSGSKMPWDTMPPWEPRP